jgi:hypothetical protein
MDDNASLGCFRRLSSYPVLWTLWSWEEDANCVYVKADFWSRCRKGELVSSQSAKANRTPAKNRSTSILIAVPTEAGDQRRSKQLPY